MSRGKTYFVGVNMGEGVVELTDYYNNELEGLNDIQIFGSPFYSLMYQDTNKKRCLDYIKQNFSHLKLWDNTRK